MICKGTIFSLINEICKGTLFFKHRNKKHKQRFYVKKLKIKFRYYFIKFVFLLKKSIFTKKIKLPFFNTIAK